MKALVIILACLMTHTVFADDVLPKKVLTFEGQKLLYADFYWAETGGYTHHHVIVVHPDDPKFEDVVLKTKDWKAYLSLGKIEIVLAHEGIYLVRDENGRRVIDIIDYGAEAPAPDEISQIEERIKSRLPKKPNHTAEPSSPGRGGSS